MDLIVMKRASSSIAKIAYWIESKNTNESGERWIEKLYEYLESNARSEAKYAICKSAKLSRYKYHCFTYNDKWVVAYKIIDDQFIIYRFIYGAKLI